MRYSEIRELNEKQHRENGERELVTSAELAGFLGSDNYNDKVEELLLDVLNDQYSAKDAVKDIRYFIDYEMDKE